MKLNKATAVPELQKGQLWKTAKGNVEIMEVGKTLTHYRLYQDQRRAPTNLGGISMVQNYLKTHKGRLVKNSNLCKTKLK